MQTIYYLILVPMVYIAFAVFFVGTGVRLYKIFREPKNPSTLQIYPERHPKWLWALHDTFLLPTVRRQYPIFWGFLMAFHIAFLLIIIGHAELFTTFRVFGLEPEHVFVGRGFAGLTICIALVYFLLRRFRSPFRELSVPEDYYLLILLFLTAVFGSEMDWARRWYEYGSMTVSTYREYLLSLLYFRPEVPVDVELSGHSFMLVLHIFFANLFLIFFPFSQSMHSFLSLPMNKLRRG